MNTCKHKYKHEPTLKCLCKTVLTVLSCTGRTSNLGQTFARTVGDDSKCLSPCSSLDQSSKFRQQPSSRYTEHTWMGSSKADQSLKFRVSLRDYRSTRSLQSFEIRICNGWKRLGVDVIEVS